MTKGDRIKQLRERVGFTQEELAARLKVTKQTIHKYEKNIVTNIPSDNIEPLATVLDSTPEYILGWEQAKEKPAISSERERKIKRATELLERYSEEDLGLVLQMLERIPSEK